MNSSTTSAREAGLRVGRAHRVAVPLARLVAHLEVGEPAGGGGQRGREALVQRAGALAAPHHQHAARLADRGGGGRGGGGADRIAHGVAQGPDLARRQPGLGLGERGVDATDEAAEQPIREAGERVLLSHRAGHATERRGQDHGARDEPTHPQDHIGMQRSDHATRPPQRARHPQQAARALHGPSILQALRRYQNELITQRRYDSSLDAALRAHENDLSIRVAPKPGFSDRDPRK
jgi:hypothetical protein